MPEKVTTKVSIFLTTDVLHCYRDLQEVFTENFHHLDSECNSQNQKQSQQSKQPEA